ncbi:hypothetical protein H3V53_13850 [Paraburkholderia bengalensis]|uniref:Holin-X, holin superfamily III n=1 Tax=Paraburkholderia bengalensis TaxID=2747562 RepID=A0ABU8IRK0_9BURK
MDPDEKSRLDWIEQAAVENMKAQHVSADNLAKDSATTLTVFLAAMAGSMTYAATAMQQHQWTWFSIAAGAFCAWFFVLSSLLVCKCLMIRAIPPVYNEPKNLSQPGFDLLILKEEELLGFQRRIDASVKRNGSVAGWLNRLRLGAVASPLIFVVAALASILI